jgi:hypothetical protein
MFSTFRKPCCSAASAGARALRRAHVLWRYNGVRALRRSRTPRAHPCQCAAAPPPSSPPSWAAPPCPDHSPPTAGPRQGWSNLLRAPRFGASWQNSRLAFRAVCDSTNPGPRARRARDRARRGVGGVAGTSNGPPGRRGAAPHTRACP